MTRRPEMFDWNHARAFLVTAQTGSLSAAARALGMTQPTVGRQVAAFEDEVGVTLFDRTGQGLSLTPAGLDLIGQVRAMGEAAEAAAIAATGQAQSLEGQVSISASEIIAAHYLPAALARLAELAPGVRVEVVATNAVSNLRKRDADIAIRSLRPAQPDLIAKKLRDVPVHLYGSVEYVATLGPADMPEALRGARMLGYDGGPGLAEALQAAGAPIDPAQMAMTCENHLVVLEMIRAGLGLGVLAADIGDADPGLQAVCRDQVRLGFPIWIAAHRELATSRRMRLVFDLLAEVLSKPPVR